MGQSARAKAEREGVAAGEKTTSTGLALPASRQEPRRRAIVEVKIEVVYGDETTLDLVGAQTSYVEGANLTSRHMNGRLAPKTLLFSKELEMLKASSVWEDAIYNLTREVKTLRVEVEEAERRFQPRTPAMAAGLTDHIWTIKELLWIVAPPSKSTRDG